MGTQRSWLATSIAAAVLLGGAHARAQTTALEWVAPPECPEARQVEARVAAIASGETIPVRGRVHVTRVSDAYRAELETSTPGGALRERVLSAETCDVLVDAIATVFVASHVERSAPASTPPVSPAGPDTSRDAAARGPRHRGRHLYFGARGVVDRGLLPETALGGAVDAAYGADTLRVEVRAGALAPSVATAPLGSSGEIHALFAEVAVCAGRVVGSVRIGGCAGMTLALLRGRGVGVGEPREEDRLVPAPRIGLDVRWPAEGAFALRGDVSGRLALARPEFSVVNEGPLHRPALAALQVALGPEVRF